MVGRRIRTVLTLVSLLSGVCLFGGASFGVQRASADLLPVTTSLTGSTFTATFSGDDAGYSFAVDTNSALSLTTGGGWIVGRAAPGFATFGFVAGVHPDGSFFGHLVYIDHGTGYVLQSTSIAPVFTFGCLGEFEGIGDDNVSALPVSFNVEVGDNGEPGTGLDAFTIGISPEASESNSGTLEGGNIQVHGTCP